MEGHVENRNIDDGRNPVRLFMFDLHLQLIILGQQLSPCAVEEGGKDTGGTTMEMEEKKNAAYTPTTPNAIGTTEMEESSQ